MEELLPNWCERKTDCFEVFAVLETKDGRAIGNAVITSELWKRTETIY